MVTEVIHAEGGGQLCVHEDGTTTQRSEFYWNSADEKPIDGVENADIGYEMDTKKAFLFDGANKIWIEQ